MQRAGYRDDIDGLRAIAVLAVVAYHYGFPGLPGGFAGVDVFFVISGYVITRKLVADMTRGAFGFWAFYASRLRRITPALVAMIAATMAVGWLILFPQEYEALSGSAAYSAIGLGNLFFYLNTGYFDLGAESQPLLHTWSLGIEEQFYFVWPLFIWIGFRAFGRNALAPVLSVVVVVGFAFSVWQTSANPSASFYLPFSRSWELALGGLLSTASPIRQKRNILGNVIPAIGFAFVAFAFVATSSATAFPGLGALPACLGAALILLPTEGPSVVARALSLRPMVAVGVISYGIYLWHWPLITLYRHASPERALSATETWTLFAATMVAAVLSYWTIERPTRRRSPWKMAAVGVAGIGLLVVSGSWISSAGGLPSRLSPAVAALVDGVNDFSPNRPRCHRTFENNPPLADSCKFGAAGVSPDTAVWGDSHGVEMSEALGPMFAEEHRSLLQITYSSCPPAQNFSSPLQNGCEAFAQTALDYISNQPEITTVILISYYNLYKDSDVALWAGFRSTVERLTASGKTILVIAPNPDPGYLVPQAAARRAMFGVGGLSMPLASHRATSQMAADHLDRLVEEYPELKVIDPAEALCGTDVCPMVADGRPIFFDDNHLSRHGAAIVARAFKGLW